MRLIMAADFLDTSSWSSVWKSDPWTSCSTNDSRTEMIMAASCEGAGGKRPESSSELGLGQKKETIGGEMGRGTHNRLADWRSGSEQGGGKVSPIEKQRERLGRRASVRTDDEEDGDGEEVFGGHGGRGAGEEGWVASARKKWRREGGRGR